MSFRAHEHLFRTMPAVKKKRASTYGPELYCYETANRSNESFITYIGSAATSSRYRYYKCELCHDSSGGDHGALKTFMDVAQHCDERSHLNRVGEITALQAFSVTARCVELQLRADQLGCKAWQLDVCKKILMCSLYQASDETKANAERIREAETALETYEHLERMSLLELAAWKAVCIVAETTNTSTMKDFYSWQEWARQGWMEKKSEMFRCADVCIIVKAVLPFLDSAPPKIEEPKAKEPAANELVAEIAHDDDSDSDEDSDSD